MINSVTKKIKLKKLNQPLANVIGLLLVFGLLLLWPLLPKAESQQQKLQQEAMQMLDRLSGKAESSKRQLQEVFDHYEKTAEKTGSAQYKNRAADANNRKVVTKQQPAIQASNKVNETTALPLNINSNSEEFRIDANAKALPEQLFDQDRDPFALTSRLVKKDELPKARGADKVQDRAYSFTRLQTGVSVPKLTLRGLILRSKNDKAAILEVQNLGTYVVREGDTISIPSNTGFNNVIKVSKIDRLSLMVEVGKLGEVIIVR